MPSRSSITKILRDDLGYLYRHISQLAGETEMQGVEVHHALEISVID